MNAIALRPPFVFDRNGARGAGQPGVQARIAVEAAGQRTEQSRDGDSVFGISATVGDPQFQRRMRQRRPHRPPDEARIGDRARSRHRIEIAVIIGVRGEQFGQAGARQFVISGEPVAHQAGAPRLPEGRGGGERQQQRDIGYHAGHQIDAAVRVGHADMHMQAADHVARAEHLEIMHQLFIARRIGRALPRPDSVGMCACRQNAKLKGFADPRQRCAAGMQQRQRVSHILQHRRGDFDLRL